MKKRDGGMRDVILRMIRDTSARDSDDEGEKDKDGRDGEDGGSAAAAMPAQEPGAVAGDSADIARNDPGAEPAAAAREQAVRDWLAGLGRDPLLEDEERVARECYPNENEALRRIDGMRAPPSTPGPF